MKAYSIGRETGCDIVINDSTNVISRRHAVLNVTPSGKMTIIDQSQNGTYVNGIRISSNVPVPVTRKDNISFAHISKLDWNMIPKQASYMTWAAIGTAIIVIAVGVIIGPQYWQSNEPAAPVTTQTDSVKAEKEDTVKTEKTKEDKVDQEKKPVAKPKKTDTKTDNKKKKEEEPKCPTCNKPTSKCEYKGKHPVNNTRGDR